LNFTKCVDRNAPNTITKYYKETSRALTIIMCSVVFVVNSYLNIALLYTVEEIFACMFVIKI